MNRLLSVLFALCLASSAYGQALAKTLSTTTCTTPTSLGCLVRDTLGVGTVGVQITGTFVGTLQFEQTVDGSTWTTWSVLPNGSTTAVTSATAAGLWSGATTAKQVRVRFSAFTSGTAVVSTVSTQAKASAGGGGGTTVTDATIAVTDITTNNVTSSAHGWTPKLSGNAYDFFTGAGTYTQTMAAGTITASKPWKFTQTWNNGAVNFEAFVIDITNTASASTRVFQTKLAGTEQVYATASGLLSAQSLDSATVIFAPTHQVGVGGTLQFSNGADYNFAITRPGGLLFAGGTLTSTSQPFNFTQTWNDGAVQFLGVTVNVTDTASATNSAMFQVNKGGTCYFAVGNASSSCAAGLSLRTNGEVHSSDFHLDSGAFTFLDAGYVQTPTRTYFHAPTTREFAIGSNGSSGKEYTIVVGSVPTCSSGCGTSPTLSATNSVGRIVLGTAPSATTVVLNFTETMPTAPACHATNETQNLNMVAVASTTQLTLTGAALVVANSITWQCISWQ